MKLIIFVTINSFLLLTEAEAGLWKDVRVGYKSPAKPITKPAETTSPPNPNPITTTNSNPGPGPVDVVNTYFVNAMNVFRSSHQSKPLVLTPALATLAAACAKGYEKEATILDGTAVTPPNPLSTAKLKAPCPNTGEGYELIFSVQGVNVSQLAPIAPLWYSEVYNFTTPDIATLPDCERKTQMLWNASTQVGCGCSAPVEPKGATAPINICSCIFNPPGNQHTGFSSAGLKPYLNNLKEASANRKLAKKDDFRQI